MADFQQKQWKAEESGIFRQWKKIITNVEHYTWWKYPQEWRQNEDTFRKKNQ